MTSKLSAPGTLLAVLFLALTGCKGPLFGPASGGSGSSTSTLTLDRMLSTYPDLASRKFQVIADFESPAQATMFRPLPPQSTGSVELSTQQARRETGVGALKMTFLDSKQQVSAQDTPESEWALIRDWTRYHLLIFSIFSPRPLGSFHFSVRSGTTLPLTSIHPRIQLNPGWNLVRIDLGLMADQVNLADVRELRFWCDPLESTVELYLDDIILVDNAQQVFGPAQPAPGDLFVRNEGRRLVVGSAERFELVFSDGLIRQWFDLSSDSLLARNLTGGQPLGPIPVAMPDSSAASGIPESIYTSAAPPPNVETIQELIDANPIRVVIRGDWRPRNQDDPAESAVRRWIYTICRDGRVYIEATGIAAGVQSPTGTGMAFCCDADAGFRPTLMPGLAENAGPEWHEPCALFSREERGRADLLIIPYGRVTGTAIRSSGDPRFCVLWRLPEVDARYSFACLVRVWPADIDGAAQAAPLVGDYRHPLPLLVDTGGLARTDPGDFDRDGFSESRGYYLLQLDGTTAKVRVVGRPYLRFSPIFRLGGVANSDVWVYVDGRQIDIQRDVSGDVFFEVSGVVSNETLIEVTSRQKGLR